MRITSIVLSSFCITAIPALSGAAPMTLFTDDFENEVGGFNAELTKWNIVQGSVDVVFCGVTGFCIDVDGSMPGSPPTIIETKESFAIEAGSTYRLSFDIPTGTAADPIRFAFGDVLDQSFESYAIPLASETSALALTGGTAPIRVELLTDTNNNFGPYLTSLTLTKATEALEVIPLPASGPLLVAGAAAFAAFRRHRRR